MESSSCSDTDLANLLISRDRISKGVKADYECLLKKFYACGSLEFPPFASIWKSMKMSMISAGRLTHREARQFIEECLLIIVTYFHPQQNFESLTGAFYVMYSLYITQSVMPKSKIRLTIKNWTVINSFIEEAISKRLHDVEFIFHKLCALKAFLYVAPPNEMAQDIDLADDDDVYIRQLFSQNSSALETIFSNDNIEQLSAIHNQYQEMKCILSGTDRTSPHSSINMLDVNTATMIAELMNTFKDDPQYAGKKKQTQRSPKKEVYETSSQKEEEISKENSSDSLKKENKTEETAQTSSASACLQEDSLSEDEDEDNCDIFYQVGDENDLIISENNDDDDDDADDEEMDHQ